MPTTTAAQVTLPPQVVAGLTPDAPLWNTTDLQDEFSVQAFLAPFVEVTRKADGQKGSLQFTRADNGVRYYFAFVGDQS